MCVNMYGEIELLCKEDINRIRLSSCPLCGGKAKIKKKYINAHMGTGVWVECNQCNITTPMEYMNDAWYLYLKRPKIQKIFDIWEKRPKKSFAADHPQPRHETICIPEKIYDLSQVEVSPCPFCESKAEIKSSIFDNNGIWIECTNCHVKTPTTPTKRYSYAIPYKREELQEIVDIWENYPLNLRKGDKINIKATGETATVLGTFFVGRDLLIETDYDKFTTFKRERISVCQ